MYLQACPTCNELEFTWTSTTTKSWNIHIMQIPCTAEWKAPEGCTQYFTGTTGTIYSYNYQSSLHLANQNYQNCIRTEEGYCSISYTAITFSVSSSGTASAIDTSCSQDYIIIPEGGTTTSPNGAGVNRYCGVFLSSDSSALGATAHAAVVTAAVPFKVHVIFDNTETGSPAPSETGTTGFAITYTQSTSC